MTTRILSFVLSILGASILTAHTSVSFAAPARPKELPATVVVRVNKATGEASVLESKMDLSTDERGAEAVNRLAGEFKAIPAQAHSEKDELSSTSSWFAYYNVGYYYAPTYYYANYAYAYRPCYNYYWGGYTYYWYRWY